MQVIERKILIIRDGFSDTTKKRIYIFTKNHHEIYVSAFKMFLDNKVLGVGVKNYRNFCNNPK